MRLDSPCSPPPTPSFSVCRACLPQTFAVGRAYDWAIHFFPHSSYVARARLDAPSCMPSDSELTHLPAAPILVTNQFELPRPRLYLPSDRFAFVARSAAPAYFEAWRIWSNAIQCAHPCYAAGVRGEHALFRLHGEASGECGPNVSQNIFNGCGECPLAAWLSNSHERLTLALAPSTGGPIVRQLNHSFATYQGSEDHPLPIAQVISELHEKRRKQHTCILFPADESARNQHGGHAHGERHVVRINTAAANATNLLVGPSTGLRARMQHLNQTVKTTRLQHHNQTTKVARSMHQNHTTKGVRRSTRRKL